MSAADSHREGKASGQSALTQRIVATPLFRDRPRNLQIVLGGVVPVIAGAIAGVLVGASAPAYWVWAILAGIGAFLSGFEHRDGWGGADRGFFGGLFYGIGLLVMHAIVGTHAKVSLGSFPPLLAVVTAIVGMLLAAGGGRIARGERAKAGIIFPDPRDTEN
jgi:apolipoprotein N-acyltransferase